MTTPLTLLLIAATALTSGISAGPSRPARPPPRPIVVHITHPGHQWRDIGIGAAGGAGVVLLVLGASLLTSRPKPHTPQVSSPFERRRR